MKFLISTLAVLFILLLIGFCSVHSMIGDGSYALGKNLYLMDFDGGKIIVQGTSVSDGICFGGVSVIPLYEEHYDSLGNVREYVINAIADERMIIAKTFLVNEQKYKYYLINKAFDEKNTSETQIRDSFTYVLNSMHELNTFREKLLGDPYLR